ncbi:MAG TPA: hypothetical protein PLD88_09980, partial [Candidatus Berkiella sp.]|nr:hypothetical protein [Candidatus Berkiella sp.]
MSLQFTPHFAQQKTEPFIVETPQTTVKYPQLYRVTKDNQVHHLLGHIHAIPLDYMPDYVLQIIQQSDCLLTEGFATLPPEFLETMTSENDYYGGFTDSFIRRLREDVKAHFHKDILELLDIFSVPNSQALKLDNLASTFLSTLFGMLISKRIDSKQLIIDTALIKFFKAQTKTIIELNDP